MAGYKVSIIKAVPGTAEHRHGHGQQHHTTDRAYHMCILHFLAHLAYMLKILILYLAHNTHMEIDTHRYRYHFYILHFLAHLAYMPEILILYLAHHRCTYAQIQTYAHT